MASAHAPNSGAQPFVGGYQSQGPSYNYPSSYHSVYPPYYGSNSSLIPNMYGNGFSMPSSVPTGAHFLPNMDNVPNNGQMDMSEEKAHFTLMLTQLARFKAENGHCRVPRVYPANPQLGMWVQSIRQQRDQSKMHNQGFPHMNSDGGLCPDQLAFLDSIGFEWSDPGEMSSFPVGHNPLHSLSLGQLRPENNVQSLSGYPENNDSAWNERFAALAKFKSQFGHCMVPARYSADPRLGHWVMTQRRQFHLMRKGRPSSMTLERISKLESLEFAWSIRMEPEKMWKMRYDELRRYKAAFGDCLVPQRFSVNPKLGTWVNTQRRHYKLLKEGKHSCMTDERIKMLQDLGFAWSTTGFNVKQGESNDNNEPEPEKHSDEESIHSVGSNLKQETES